jgi:hypothetical protein
MYVVIVCVKLIVLGDRNTHTRCKSNENNPAFSTGLVMLHYHAETCVGRGKGGLGLG